MTSHSKRSHDRLLLNTLGVTTALGLLLPGSQGTTAAQTDIPAKREAKRFQKKPVPDFVAKCNLAAAEIDDASAWAEKSQPPLAEQVVNLLKTSLLDVAAPDEPFQFQVLPLPNGEYVVVLSGTYYEDMPLNVILARKKAEEVRLPAHWRLNDKGLISKRINVPPDPQAESAKWVALVEKYVNNPKVSVTAARSDDGKFTLFLKNKNPTIQLPSAAVEAAVKAAQIVQSDKVTIFNQLQAYTPITRVHTLRFLRDGLPDVVGKNQGGGSADISSIGVDAAASKLATFLSALYPGSTTVTDHENRLVIKGDPEQVQHIRQMLALYVDVPSPQVRADVWTIQVNSRSTRPHSREHALQKIEEIRAGIQIVRDLMQGSQIVLAQYLGTQSTAIETNLQRPVYQGQTPVILGELMGQAGFDIHPQRPLSTTEMLVFMTFTDRQAFRTQLDPNQKSGLAHEYEKSLESIKKTLETDVSKTAPEVKPEDFGPGNQGIQGPNWLFQRESKVWHHRQPLVKLIDKMLRQVQTDRKTGRYLLDRVAKLYDPTFEESDRVGFGNFLIAWRDCAQMFLTPAADYNPTSAETNLLPGQLSTRSAAADLLIKQAMDALTADMQELFILPLLDWIREDVQRNDAEGSGVDLVGTTRLVVRDRTLGETAGTAESFYKFTPIPQFGEDLLTGAKTLSNGTAPSADQPQQTVARDKNGNVIKDAKGDPVILSNGQALAFDKNGEVIKQSSGDPVLLSVLKSGIASTALGPLSPLAALGIKALFASQADPVFRSVAPGTSLAIRPFVLPDGGSARVQMNLVTTVDAQQPDAGKEAQQGLPVDRIKSQSVVTETTISAFDLVEVSTFGVQTTRPGDYQWRIPILASLPLIGSLFHGPQSRETHRQESIAIVNLTILPRSLDLVPFYAGHLTPITSRPVSDGNSRDGQSRLPRRDSTP